MPLLYLVLAILMPTLALAQDTHMEKARRVLQAVPLVDGHNDLPWYIRTDVK
jgi:membrane dipeptidase